MEDVIYLKVPISYKPTYDKLLRCLADFGKEALDDCNKNTKSVNSNVISCWNMFQTAIACYELGRFKEANLFIEYINKQLNIIYKNSNITIIETETDVVIYKIFIGAHPSDILNFDITNPEYFKEFRVTNSVVGDYTFYNPTYGNYGWICIPNNFGDIIAKTNNGMFDVPLNNYIETIVDGTTYKCYRIKDALVDGNHTINIRMK